MALSKLMAPIYRGLPPQTRVFLRLAIEVATVQALSEVPDSPQRSVRHRRHQARLWALYRVLQLVMTIDLSNARTGAAVHLAVVRAMAPVFLDPAFLTKDDAVQPVEWPPFIDDGA